MKHPASGPNPIHPDYLTTKDRLGEVCRLLALGLFRLRARDHAKGAPSSRLSPGTGDSSVDYPETRSGYSTSHEVDA